MPLYNSKISGKATPLLLQALILKTGVLLALAVIAVIHDNEKRYKKKITRWIFPIL